MTLPVEIDFAIIKIGNGAATEVFTAACGIENVSINEGVNTDDRFVRDCAAPGEIPWRKNKATGRTLTITGDGHIDKAQIATYRSALGLVGNFQIECYADAGDDTGTLIGTWSGAYMMVSHNENIPRNGSGTAEIVLNNDGEPTWTAA